MCRYSYNSHKSHHVCFDCKVSVKPAFYGEIPGANPDGYKRDFFTDEKEYRYPARSGRLCPTCRSEMFDVGRDFRAPRKSDKRAWRALETLVKAGVRFHSCGCSGPGWRPESPWQARQYVAQAGK